MGHGHDHAHGPRPGQRAGARHRRALVISLVLVGGFAAVEVIGGIVTGSLALLSDAAHMVTDVVGLAMAVAAITAADRHERRAADPSRGTSRHTFGLYRLEILAAFLNAILLVGVAVYVLIEALDRIGDPPDLAAAEVLVIALGGLVVNLIAFALLRAGAKESINVEGAYLEVLADTVGSVAVIVAAGLVAAFGWTWADVVIGAAIACWILPRSIRLGGRAVRILLQSAPSGVDLDALQRALEALPGVVDVHDLHVWTLTSDMDAASAHLMVGEGGDHHVVLDRAVQLLADDYGISHATFQVEPHTHELCADIEW